MKQFFSDLFRERRNGKASSKKIWGHIIMFLVGASYILDGLHFYNINSGLFNSMLIAGATMLGLRGLMSIFGKKSEETTDESKD